MMKISFLVGAFSYGGGERIQNMLINEFDSKGNKISIYTWDNSWLTVRLQKNTRLSMLKTPPVALKGKALAYKELREVLKSDYPDCLIIFSLSLAEVGVFAAKSLNIPTILSERCDPYYLPKSKLHRKLKQLVYHISDGIVFQTKDVQQYFSSPIQHKSCVIPNPIIDDYLPTPNIRYCCKEIVAVGRLSEEKNYELLIRTFALIQEKITPYVLKIYGDGPLKGKLQDLINDLGVRDKIILMGSVDRVITRISDSDIFVMTSLHEGMPNALIEAMAMGLACISTDVRSGGTRALIQDNINGLLIPLNDGVSLGNAILTLVCNENLKLRLKQEALKLRDTHSKHLILPMWQKYIIDVCNKKKTI